MQPVYCLGSVLWDIVGRVDAPLVQGNDRGGRITMVPGGVAMNIAMALKRMDSAIDVTLVSYLGQDREGDMLLSEAKARGIGTDWIHRASVYPTDRYMAIEAEGKLFAAVADAHSLESMEDAVWEPFRDGRLASEEKPFDGTIVIDGNLTGRTLTHLSNAPELENADLRIVPASPGKADRLRAFLGKPHATLYVNREEAEIITGERFKTSDEAAEYLAATGLRQALVTDGPDLASAAMQGKKVIKRPPQVEVKRITGAGDSFLAAHIAAERMGKAPTPALSAALRYASDYVSTEGAV